MRADRLLSLLLLLQNRGRMTARELANELEVSVRTVYRDVEALTASGVPVCVERGPAGGYRLIDGYRTRLTGLTDAEAGALFFAGAPGPARDLGFGAVLATAQLKVQAALPPELAGRTRRVQERFHLDAPAWFREADSVPYLASVAQAVWEQRELRVRYRRWKGEVHRRLRPLGIVLKGGIWYLVALAGEAESGREAGKAEGAERDQEAGEAESGREAGEAKGVEKAGGAESGREAGEAGAAEETEETEEAEETEGDKGEPGRGAEASGARTYRISRFLAVDVTDELFERPAEFELAAYWDESSRRLEAAMHQGTARLRISPRVQRLLPMQFGAAGTRALRSAGPPDGDGWVRVELPVESQAVAVGDLLGLGPEAEVLGPPELRRAVTEAVAVLAHRYEAGAPL